MSEKNKESRLQVQATEDVEDRLKEFILLNIGKAPKPQSD